MPSHVRNRIRYINILRENHMKIIIKQRQHYQSKMTPDELQAHLQMARTGASKTKNSKAYRRHDKHKKGY